jgi:hypothetical protein
MSLSLTTGSCQAPTGHPGRLRFEFDQDGATCRSPGKLQAPRPPARRAFAPVVRVLRANNILLRVSSRNLLIAWPFAPHRSRRSIP